MLEPEGPMQALLRATLRCRPQGPRLPAARRGGPHPLYAQPRGSVFLTLTAGSPSGLPCVRPVVESRHSAGGAHGVSQHLRGGRWAVFQVASDALPESVPMITSPIAPIRRSRPELPLCPTAEFSFSCVGTPATV